jgi:hypothetical protein
MKLLLLLFAPPKAHSYRYGDDKGACENIFSYGFIEDNMTSARVMFLDLSIPDDDPLRPAKLAVNTAAPGLRIYETDDRIDWESDFVWLVAINEEDGLDFKLRQTVDGQREIQAFWKEHELNDTFNLKDILSQDPLWDIYQLRAVVLLQSRVEAQLETLQEYGTPPHDVSVRDVPYRLAERLRRLEYELLQKSGRAFEDQVSAPYRERDFRSSRMFSTCQQHRCSLQADIRICTESCSDTIRDCATLSRFNTRCR